MLSHSIRQKIKLRLVSQQTTKRAFNFGSTDYNDAIHSQSKNPASKINPKLRPQLPTPNFDQLRRATISYIDGFNPQVWYDEPIVSIVNGQRMGDSKPTVDTVDAFGNKNGSMKYATDQELGNIIRHVANIRPKSTDYREPIRMIENILFEEYSGELIGNQALDFWKQDGVTEIEESLLANPVEWAMNDDLLQAEIDGKIKINRAPAFVGCVSNFSNFLDLFRKTLRNLELGVPVVVLSRTNTAQHCFRWFEILLDLVETRTKIPNGMLTFAAVHPDNIQHIFDSVSEDCPMYMTCSRDLAKLVKKGKSNVIASTGGPNTLVTNDLDGAKEAIRVSGAIENSGQCTAMRHVVVGNSEGLNGESVESIFDSVDVVSNPSNSLRDGKFAGIFESAPFFSALPRDYTTHPKVDMAYKLNKPGDLPAKDLEEHWRRVVVDFSQREDKGKIVPNSTFTDDLCNWLVANQPISVAVNDDGNSELFKYVWERSGGVVYTKGNDMVSHPALTCQARPQEGEIFGEFPVRRDLRKYSKFPVIVPSPTPAYNASYNQAYLLRKGGESLPDYVRNYIASCTNPEFRGYMMEIGEYLIDATASGPRHGCGERTVLWGLQRPPVDGAPTIFRVKDDEKLFDDLSVKLLPFFMTNARKSAVVVVEGGDKNGALAKKLKAAGVTDKMSVEFTKFDKKAEAFNVAKIRENCEDPIEFCMVGQFVSLYLCVGHVKSTLGGDKKFVSFMSDSEKWLRVNKS